MTISRRKLIVTLGIGSAASLLPRSAFAAYPDRPIHLIVPFAPGGNADIVGRTYDEVMPMYPDDGRFKASALNVLAKSFVELNTLPAEPDMSKLYTEAFLPAK